MSAGADLRAAVAFLTPVGKGKGTNTPTPVTMAYFPIVGTAMGWILGTAWKAASRQWAPLTAATVVVVGDCALTGALHLDGLADTADGLFAHAPGSARLDIMADPHIGTFAAVAIGVALLSRAAALASLKPSPALLAAVYCSSRSVMVVASRALPYARGEGIASAFMAAGAHDDPALVAGLAGAGAALALAAATAGRRGAASVVAGWAAGAAILEIARRRLGGFTGDVLGATGVVAETVTLLGVALRPRTAMAP